MTRSREPFDTDLFIGYIKFPYQAAGRVSMPLTQHSGGPARARARQHGGRRTPYLFMN